MRECRFLVIALLVCFTAWGAGRSWADDDDEGDEKVPNQTEPKTDTTPAEAAAAKDDQYFELMRVFADTFEQIDRNYVKDVDRRKLIEAALRGMMDELDPYSNYISPEEQQRFNEQIEQEFTGIGIQVQPDPMTTSSSMTTNGPMDAPGPIFAEAAIRAAESTPPAGFGAL